MKSTVILFGGSSSERLVSVASAQNVSTNLPDARLWFLSTSGEVFDVARPALAAHTQPFVNAFTPPSAAAWPDLKTALCARR